jgi:hypothetical protein
MYSEFSEFEESAYWPQKQSLKLKNEFEFSDNDDMEVIDLAQDYPTSYSDLAPRNYRKLHNLHRNVQEDKALRLVTQKPQYQYGSGNPPQIPFAHAGTDREDIFDDRDYLDEDFPSPSAIIQGSKNRSLTLSSPRAAVENRTHANMGDKSHSGACYEEGTIELPEKPTVSILDQYPDSSFGNDSLGSLEAGMLELDDPMTRAATVATSPKLTSSFVDGVFDFEAFNNGIGSQESHLSLSAYQPAGLHPPAEKYTKEPTKRARSPTPDGEAVKCRRITKDLDTTRIPEATREEFKPVYPEWLNEFDADFINGFKDFVDFVD